MPCAYKMPNKSGGGEGEAGGDARMRQLIMALTKAQSAAALQAPAMPALVGRRRKQVFAAYVVRTPGAAL